MSRIFILVSVLWLPACASLEDLEQAPMEGEIHAKRIQSPFEPASSRELDEVDGWDVAKCLFLVEGTVATLGNLPRIANQLGRLGHGLNSLDTATVNTIGGWIATTGMTGQNANGLAWLLVKAGEVAGLVTAGGLTVTIMKQLVDIALDLLNSCSLVLQTYVDGIKSIGAVLGYEPPVRGCADYDGFIECQETCGASLSARRQIDLWDVPNICLFEPMESVVLGAWQSGYIRYCMERHCTNSRGYEPPRRFSHCVWRGTDDARDIIENMESKCQEAARVDRIINGTQR